MQSGNLCVLTWNIHAGIGMDGVRDYARSIDCLKQLAADIVALQEIDGRMIADGATPFDDIGRRLELHGVPAPAISTIDGNYGQLLLSRWPFVASRVHDISLPGYEPRRAIEATIRTEQGALRIIATHLGLRIRERRRQAEQICDIVSRSELPTVLLGDFNDWNRFQMKRGLLEKMMPAFTRARTFPSRRPIFALDRIYCRPPLVLGSNRSVKAASAISDHLPLVAHLA